MQRSLLDGENEQKRNINLGTCCELHYVKCTLVLILTDLGRVKTDDYSSSCWYTSSTKECKVSQPTDKQIGKVDVCCHGYHHSHTGDSVFAQVTVLRHLWLHQDLLHTNRFGTGMGLAFAEFSAMKKNRLENYCSLN